MKDYQNKRESKFNLILKIQRYYKKKQLMMIFQQKANLLLEIRIKKPINQMVLQFKHRLNNSMMEMMRQKNLKSKGNKKI